MTQHNRSYVTGDRVRIVTPDFGVINVGKGGTVVRVYANGFEVKIDGYAYPLAMYPSDVEPATADKGK